jgi:hypothetical protein
MGYSGLETIRVGFSGGHDTPCGTVPIILSVCGIGSVSEPEPIAYLLTLYLHFPL